MSVFVCLEFNTISGRSTISGRRAIEEAPILSFIFVGFRIRLFFKRPGALIMPNSVLQVPLTNCHSWDKSKFLSQIGTGWFLSRSKKTHEGLTTIGMSPEVLHVAKWFLVQPKDEPFAASYSLLAKKIPIYSPRRERAPGCWWGVNFRGLHLFGTNLVYFITFKVR